MDKKSSAKTALSVMTLAKLMTPLMFPRSTGRRKAKGMTPVGITRKNKEESKKRRKMAKASRRINRKHYLRLHGEAKP